MNVLKQNFHFVPREKLPSHVPKYIYIFNAKIDDIIPHESLSCQILFAVWYNPHATLFCKIMSA